MKRSLLLAMLSLTLLAWTAGSGGEVKRISRYNTLTRTWASYPLVTIHDIQYCPPESLHVADSIQNVPGKWTLQASSYTKPINDTVVIVAQVIAPYYVITYTQHGYTMLLKDTAANAGPWSGILVRVGNTGSTPDTTQAQSDGFLNPERGDIIMITGRVEEFSPPSMNTTTQLRPIPGIPIEIVGSAPIPPAVPLTVADFYHGPYPGGTVDYSHGEPYEMVMVKLTNVTVTALVNSARGTYDMVDQSGNHISDYDESYYFSFTSSETPPIIPDTSVTHFYYPPIGATIDSIKGFISTVSGGENPRGYRICPLYYGDVSFGVSLPSITLARRNPVIPTSSDSVEITARVARVVGGYDVAQAFLFTSINNGPWTNQAMNIITTDSIYQAWILDQDGNPFPANTQVRYYIKGVDNHGNSKILANASSSSGFDSTQGFFAFTVLDRPLTIHDIQYTPYPIGVSEYNGGVATVSGIVTGDTSDIGITPLNTGGTNAWYIQNGSGPWTGIWVAAKDTVTRAALAALHHGDSVVVTGTIQENFGVTRILDSLVTVVSPGHPSPAPAVITTSTFGFHGDGYPGAEEYEGVLVRVLNATVTSINPTFSDQTEYEITDSTGIPMLVRRDGRNTYSNQEGDTTTGSTHILHVGDVIDTLTGIGYFSFSRYKIDPRTDADYKGVGIHHSYRQGWNMVSVGKRQLPESQGYQVSLLYPGRSSAVFGYTGSAYNIASTVAPGHGYWVKFGAPTTISQLGANIAADTIQVSPGWNLIGATAASLATTDIVSNPPGNLTSKFFGYTGSGYTIAPSLSPAQGYWVKAASSGYLVEVQSSLILPKSPAAAPHFNSVTFSDDQGNSQTLSFVRDQRGEINTDEFIMPPPSPTGFDARYVSGRALETYSGVTKTPEQFPILVQHGDGPLSVSWNIVEANGAHFSLVDGSGNAIGMRGSGSVKSFRPAGGITLTVGSGAPIPRSFSLSQNYPNPFNPSTRMEIGVPFASRISVEVYDILGRKVRTLVNDDRPAGYETITWNGLSDEGTPVSSGIYFVRMAAAKFTQVQKIMMMK